MDRHAPDEPDAPELSRARSPGDLLAQLVLVVLALLPFAPALFGDRCILSFDTRLPAFPPFGAVAPPDVESRPANFVTPDLNGWIVPETTFALEELRAGRVPLWNPYVLCGQPLLANLAFPAFYPPNLLALLFADPLRAIAWIVVLHFALAGVLAFRFLRGHGVTVLAALFGGVAVELAPWLTARLHLPSIVATAAWFFGILIAVDAVLARPSRRSLAALGFCVGMAALAGFPQLLGIELIGAAVYGLVRLCERGREARLRSVGCAAGGVVLGIALGGIHLFPALELLPDSLRKSAVDPVAQAERGMKPAALIGLALPDFFGHPVERDGIPPQLEAYGPHRELLGTDPQENPVENMLWPGTIVIVLLLAGVPFRRRPCLALLALVAVGCVLGFATPFLSWLYGNASSLAAGSPKRVLVLLAMALPALAAFALDRLFESKWQAMRLSIIAMLVAAVPFLFAVIGSRADGGEAAPWWATDYLLARTLGMAPWPLALALVAFGAFALGGQVLRNHRHTASASWLGVGAAIVVAGELASHAVRFNPTQVRAGQYPATPAIEFLRDSNERSVRFADHVYAAAPLAPLLGYRCFDGAEPMVLTRTGELIESIEPGRFDRIDPRFVDAIEKPESLFHPAFLRGACPLVVTGVKGIGLAEVPGLELVYRNDAEALGVFRQPKALPRVRLVAGHDVIVDKNDRLRRLADPSVDATQIVLLERPPAVAGSSVASGPKALAAGTVKLVSETATGLAFEIEGLASPALLVVADSYHDGWIAEVDGVVSETLAADHAFRAVALPAGAKRVEMRYAPRSFTAGWVSTLAASVLVAFLALTRRRPRPSIAGTAS